MTLFHQGLDLSVVPPPNQFSTGSMELLNAQRLVSEVQRFRGRIYVEDAAIPESALDSEGRHRSDFDSYCYHICLRAPAGDLAGVGRVRLYETGIAPSDLNLYSIVARSSPDIRPILLQAIAESLEAIRQQGLTIGEVGGWALDRTKSAPTSVILVPLAAWGLARQLGNAITVAAATSRHSSADILVRIGAYYLRMGGTVVPEFYDSEHRCGMRLLGFDSRSITRSYERFIPKIQFAPLNDDLNDAADKRCLQRTNPAQTCDSRLLP